MSAKYGGQLLKIKDALLPRQGVKSLTEDLGGDAEGRGSVPQFAFREQRLNIFLQSNVEIIGRHFNLHAPDHDGITSRR
jgi:hypothetical protein